MFQRNWHLFVLTAIVLGSAGLSLAWVFRVPIFQSPDEPQHLDFALCHSEVSGLFRARDMRTSKPDYYVHPYTEYLIARAWTTETAFQAHRRMPPYYGRRSYFRALDRNAPPRETIAIENAPCLVCCYPFGYYFVLGKWIEVVRSVGAGLTVQFFAARILSVVMLMGSLTLCYAIARELRLSKAASLFLTASIGFFPLTSFISSYVQPDNQSFLLSSACFLTALIARRRPADFVPSILLGLCLGGLLLTKLHYFLAIFVAAMSAVLIEQRAARVPLRRSLALAAVLITPAMVGGVLYLATAWGNVNYFAPSAPLTQLPWDALIRTERAIADFAHGTTFVSFWGYFGWLDCPLIIIDATTTTGIFFLLRLASWVAIALTLLRIERIATRLFRIARSGRGFRALRIAVSNPVVNACFVFAALMIALHVRLDNRFGAQGRNWFPMLLPIFYVALVFAPKALSTRFTQRSLTTVFAVGLTVFVLAGSICGLSSIHNRYYDRSDDGRRTLAPAMTPAVGPLDVDRDHRRSIPLG